MSRCKKCELIKKSKILLQTVFSEPHSVSRKMENGEVFENDIDQIKGSIYQTISKCSQKCKVSYHSTLKFSLFFYSYHVDFLQQAPDIEDFEVIKPISRGAFGYLS